MQNDFVDEMFTPDDAVYNLEDSENQFKLHMYILSMGKYFDQDNSQ